jgi:hypothetical protein
MRLQLATLAGLTTHLMAAILLVLFLFTLLLYVHLRIRELFHLTSYVLGCLVRNKIQIVKL